MAKNQNQQTATSQATCASCKRDVGIAAGRLPFNVDDSASTSGEAAKHEAFCPQCFVYVRSPREPERWRPGCFVPIRCSSVRCAGLESVTVHVSEEGRPVCMQCGSGTALVLPPKLGAS